MFLSSEGCSEEMHMENYIYNNYPIPSSLDSDSGFLSPLEAMEACLKGL